MTARQKQNYVINRGIMYTNSFTNDLKKVQIDRATHQMGFKLFLPRGCSSRLRSLCELVSVNSDWFLVGIN